MLTEMNDIDPELACVTIMLATGRAVALEVPESSFEEGLTQFNTGQIARFTTYDGQEHLFPVHAVVYINRRTHAAMERGVAEAKAKELADSMLAQRTRR
jgi:hypothetical protein